MHVKPYATRGKSDAVDAEAICETVTRPTIRFVEIKSEEQQALLFLHQASSASSARCSSNRRTSGLSSAPDT
jgi:transposase